jgi:hypothetical protein
MLDARFNRKDRAMPQRPSPFRRAWRAGGAGLALAPVLLAACPAAAEPDRPAFAEPLPAGAIEATYHVYSGGFQALTLQLRVEELEPQAYAARFHARSDGFWSTFFTFRLDSEAEGRRTGEGVSPRRFRTEARWSDEDPRRVTLTYAPDGAVAAEVVPPPEEDERAQVPADARVGTLDPNSAAMKLLHASTEAGQCAGEAQIFDGRRRLDIAAEPLGLRQIEPASYALYAGPALACNIRLEPITGFWEGEERRERYPGEVRVFLAEVVEGRPALPVRLEMDIVARGAVRAHLVALQVGEQRAAR